MLRIDENKLKLLLEKERDILKNGNMMAWERLFRAYHYLLLWHSRIMNV